jgi:hypothetical protein
MAGVGRSSSSTAAIRGPKPLWRIFATQSFVGPAAYYALGRR